LLALLLVAIVLGLAFSSARSALEAASSHGHSPQPQPPQLASIWASRRNPLNRYFAKLAWAWTTALFLGAVAAASRHRSPAATLRHLTRYALATLYWVVMTQWFFGPPLFDRLFLHTGGVCMLPPPPHAQPPAVSTNSLKSCRSAGGSWVGGHDISGHCFLLLHSALFLVEEAAAAIHWIVVAGTVGLICIWALMLYFTAKYFHGIEELVTGTLLGVGYWA
ncbi:inositol phospholipid synthesis and fat-storage-inducing TM-domain-containing protein, partial [Coemansia spiralis]